MRTSHVSGRSSGGWKRRTVLAAPALIAAVTLVGCTGGGGDREAESKAPATAVLPDDLEAVSVALSTASTKSSSAAVVGTAENADAVAQAGAAASVPALIGVNEKTAKELTRLGVTKLAVPKGTDTGALNTDAEVIEFEPSKPDDVDLPKPSGDKPAAPFTLFVDPKGSPKSGTFAKTVAEGAGASVVNVPGGDPRATSETVGAAKKAAGDAPAHGALAVGESFGDSNQFVSNLTTATTSPELPGGGQVVVPGRRMIAAYGAPGTPSLGILGEQGLDESIQRIADIAKEYEPYSDLPVVPAFELIATVASSSAGDDGDYSADVPMEVVTEWVEGAGDAGVYVVLDLQPGTTDFLTQAKRFEELLKKPHVGLALDAEWRLKPGQKHLEQIGSVDAAEVNEVSDWLATLTRDNHLPQKVFILHQFAHGMIRDRETVKADHPELAMMLHADGHGTPDLKMGTWNALQQGLPEGIHMAWKNFYDEDTPTFTPEETYKLEPRPWFVSYQ